MKTYLEIWKKVQVKIKITYLNGKTYEGYIESFDDLGLFTRIEKSERGKEMEIRKPNWPTMHPWLAIQSITYIR